MTDQHILPEKLRLLLKQNKYGKLVASKDLDHLPSGKGAYLLLITIDQPFQLEISTLPLAEMMRGVYAYCGSARGPGGIKARLTRHFASDKRKHWHVDHLTLPSSNLWAIGLLGGDECELNADLMATGQFSNPVTGFGASDCNICPSHLLFWQDL